MKRILIVDDSAFQRSKLKSLLADSDFELDVAGNGRECLELVRSEPYDGVLLDIVMPNLNGIETLRIMREEGIETPVIFITADVQDSTRRQCFDLGCSAIIHKPQEKKELLLHLERNFFSEDICKTFAI